MRYVCQDCLEKNNKFKGEATIIFFPDYEPTVRLLCERCFGEYAYAEGEFNLTYYDIDDFEGFIREIRSKLEYFDKKERYMLNEYKRLKDEIEQLRNSASNENEEGIKEYIKKHAKDMGQSWWGDSESNASDWSQSSTPTARNEK